MFLYYSLPLQEYLSREYRYHGFSAGMYTKTAGRLPVYLITIKLYVHLPDKI